MRQRWLTETGESIAAGKSSSDNIPTASVTEKVDLETQTGTPASFGETLAFDAIAKAVQDGVTDEQELNATAQRAVAAAHSAWRKAASAAKMRH